MSEDLVTALALTWSASTLFALAATFVESWRAESRGVYHSSPFETVSGKYLLAPLFFPALAALPFGLVWAIVEAWGRVL